MIKEISVEEAIKMLKGDENVILLDVRTQQEYYTEHVKGSKWIPLDQVSYRLQELDKKKAIFACFCRTGLRSFKACEFLKENGFEELYNVKGGIEAWKQAGYETVKNSMEEYQGSFASVNSGLN
ncbi:MAG: rhodanese-like domain-containing protein [Nitrospirota bacterium]